MRLSAPAIVSMLLAVAATTMDQPVAHAGGVKKAARRGAERAVAAKASKVAPQRLRVRCTRRGRAGYDCVWAGGRSAVRQGTDLCRGRYRVRRVKSSWRLRLVSRRCNGARPVAHQLVRPQHPGPAHGTPPLAQPGHPHFGFSEYVESNPAKHAELARGVKADSQRLTLGWNWAEPSPGHYALSGFDSTYRASVAQGIRPLITILFSPSWTWGPGIHCSGPNCTYPPAPEFDAQWRQFAALVAQRYPQAIGIEIWNEANLTAFWKPRPDVGRYTDLLKQAYGAIRSVNPTMPVIAGGLADPDNNQDGNIFLTDFVRGVYEHGGKNYLDGIGVHPYGSGLDDRFVRRTLDRVRVARDAYGDQKKPLWATEFGLTTTGSPWPRAWTEDEQARGLAGQLGTLTSMPDVDAIYLHTLVEPTGPATSTEPGYGVVRRDFSPRPAYCAIARARAGSAPGCN
jgi:polysaccharide biosynthesis protein PslG